MSKFLVIVLLLVNTMLAKDIMDMAGRKVVVPDNIDRVFATAPPMMMLVYLLEPKKLIASSYTTKMSENKYLDRSLTSLLPISGWHGGTNGANMEELLSLKPQMLIAWKNTFVMGAAEASANKFNIPVVFVKEDDVEDEPAAIRFVGNLLNDSKKAEKIAKDADSRIGYVKQIVSRIPEDKKPVVYYTTDASGLTTQCSKSFHVAALRTAGAKMAFECTQNSMGGIEQISIEKILLVNPDVILAYDAAFLKTVYSDQRWASIKAVKNKKVYLTPRDPINFLDRPPSFMRILGVEWLAYTLYPQEYKKDIFAQVASFYKMYLRRDITKEEALKIIKP